LRPPTEQEFQDEVSRTTPNKMLASEAKGESEDDDGELGDDMGDEDMDALEEVEILVEEEDEEQVNQVIGQQ